MFRSKREKTKNILMKATVLGLVVSFLLFYWLAVYLDQGDSGKDKADVLIYLLLATFGLSLVLGAVTVAVAYEWISPTRYNKLSVTKPLEKALEAEDIYWLPKNNWGLNNVYLLWTVGTIGMIYSVVFSYGYSLTVALGIIVSFMVLIVYYKKTNKLISKQRLGVFEEWVFVDDGLGRIKKAHCSQVLYCEFAFVVDGMGLYYLNPIASTKGSKRYIFANKDLEKILRKCAYDNQLSEFDMNRLLNRINQPVMKTLSQGGILIGLSLLLVSIMFAYVY